jgi:modulator of FtsH protease
VPDFAAAIESWHDFYLAVAGASAALLGLLFVGVSINLAAIAAAERVDLRALAGQAFVNLVYVLFIALTMLVPQPDPTAFAIAFAVIGTLGLVRAARNMRSVARGRPRLIDQMPIVRRLGWTVAADALLLIVAVNFFTVADARMAIFVMIAVFILMIGAADVAWRVLVEATRDRPN